jgi:CMP-N-acetylneuraminic acid synthetase
MKPLVIVPAREGSAGVPQKNFRALPDGSTLVSRAVKIGQQIGHVIVSTDYEGYEPPMGVGRILRPAYLATGSASMGDVVRHALRDYLGKEDVVVLLQPTSPFRTVRLVQTCIAKLKNSPHLDLVITVGAVPDTYRPSRMLRDDGDGTLYPVTEWANNRQEAPVVYIPTGEAYVFRREAVPFVFDYTRLQAGYVYVRTPSVNINTREDWQEACAIISSRRRNVKAIRTRVTP